jgi:hypothetical protein
MMPPEKYVVDEHGKPVYALVPMEEMQRLARPDHQDSLRIVNPVRTMQEAINRHTGVRKAILLGPARSGTSVTCRLLNTHPKILMTYESIYSPFLQELDTRTLLAYYYEVAKQRRHLDSAVCLEANKHKPFAHQSNYDVFGDKMIYSPSPAFREKLVRALRRTKIDKCILLMRDPRALAASTGKWKERRNREFTQSAPENYDLNKLMDMWLTFATDILNIYTNFPQVIVTRYEDMVTRPEEAFHRLLQFLGADAGQCPPETTASVHSRSLEAWKNTLTEQEVNFIREKGGTPMDKFGYR